MQSKSKCLLGIKDGEDQFNHGEKLAVANEGEAVDWFSRNRILTTGLPKVMLARRLAP